MECHKEETLLCEENPAHEKLDVLFMEKHDACVHAYETIEKAFSLISHVKICETQTWHAFKENARDLLDRALFFNVNVLYDVKRLHKTLNEAQHALYQVTQRLKIKLDELSDALDNELLKSYEDRGLLKKYAREHEGGTYEVEKMPHFFRGSIALNIRENHLDLHHVPDFNNARSVLMKAQIVLAYLVKEYPENTLPFKPKPDIPPSMK